jgi:hypothetical protein
VLQNNITKVQANLTIAQTTLTHKNEIVDSQSKQLEKLQSDYTSVVSELAVMKSKLEGEDITRKAVKKRLTSV